jgi:hypothetical protein
MGTAGGGNFVGVSATLTGQFTDLLASRTVTRPVRRWQASDEHSAAAILDPRSRLGRMTYAGSAAVRRWPPVNSCA